MPEDSRYTIAQWWGLRIGVLGAGSMIIGMAIAFTFTYGLFYELIYFLYVGGWFTAAAGCVIAIGGVLGVRCRD